ncbi:MAG: DUF4404 family protein [Planctomycetes bacterium]|nr:DUF4404 family protein [Planctomycetota bacterium]
MSDQPSSHPATTIVHAHLHTISQLLRTAHPVGPETQALLADLLDEIGTALDTSSVPPEEVARLTECASHLAQAVADESEPGILQAAEERLEGAVVAVEMKAPALANLTRRLAEMLSNLGI